MSFETSFARCSVLVLKYYENMSSVSLSISFSDNNSCMSSETAVSRAERFTCLKKGLEGDNFLTIQMFPLYWM